jgi:tetratricopeptide (TPR) repeat protein
MSRRLLFGSTAVWAVAMTMLVADPVLAQRGGRGGGGGGNRDGGNRDGGNRDGGNRGGNRDSGSRQWSGGNQHRSSGNVPGASNRSDGTRTWSRSDGQVRTAPSTSNRDGQRSYQRDRNQWTDNNYRWNDNNRSGNQWSSPYSGPRTQRNYPYYGNNRNSGLYGGLFGSNNYWGNYYGNNVGRSYGSYGPNAYYGNGYGYGSGLGNLIGLATGLSGVGGFGVPGIGLGYGGYGGYGYGGYGYSGYGPFGSNSGYYSTPYVVDRYVVNNSTADTYVTTPATSGDFLASGKAAFLAGDYAAAQRQANHAVVENPENAKAHELMMLSMFAQGEFRGAAAAAHAVADLGQVPDWPTLYGYYKDRDKYVQHLEKLQQFAKENPDAPEAKFLLGFNYQMLGDKAQAEKQFAKYINAVNGEDQIAVKLFSSVGGDVTTLPKPDTQVPVNALDNPANSTTQD